MDKDGRSPSLDEQIQTTNRTARAFAKDTLRPEQMARLEGVYYQNAPRTTLAVDETLQAKLSVAAEQKAAFQTLAAEHRRAQIELTLAAIGSTPSEVQPKVLQLQAQFRDRVLALLNESQKKTWAELVGAPFTMQPAVGGRRGGESE